MLADWLPAILMCVLFAMGTPISFAIAISALSFFVVSGEMPLNIFVQKMVTVTDSYPLLAIPFFVLAGAIMNKAGITGRLLALADAMVGPPDRRAGADLHRAGHAARRPDRVVQRRRRHARQDPRPGDGQEQLQPGLRRGDHVLLRDHHLADPAFHRADHLRLRRRRVDRPPVHRRRAAGAADRRLADAGDLVHRASAAATCRSEPTFAGRKELGRTFREAVWALSIPVFIIVGIRYGIFTPTEAGAITVLYVILVGRFAYRSLRLRDLPELLKETALDTSSVMLMICAASAFGFYLAWERIPPQMAAWLVTLTQDPVALLLLINVLLIVLGTAVEGTSALIILTPIFVPILTKLGIDPVHFGIVLVTNLTIAGVTPPVGQMMFISSRVLRVPMDDYTIEVLPFLGILMVVLVLLTLFPQITLLLPNAVFGP